MSSEKQGTPSLVIQTDSLFGGKQVEKVTVDSNRLDPVIESRERLIRALVHPRFVDALFDALLWTSSAAFIASILLHTPFLTYFQVPFLLFVGTGAAGLLYGLFCVPGVQIPICYRLVLLISGLVIGGRPL